MGFTTTFTRDYHNQGSTYAFHTDTDEREFDTALIGGSKDWIQLTLLYYLVDPAHESLAASRPGQGSTLYNPQDCETVHEQSQVRYCPLRNGAIAIFDGGMHHAVGPNYGVERGAVVYKAVLFKPEHTTERGWSRQQWWDNVMPAILEIAAQARDVAAVPLETIRLCDALREPDIPGQNVGPER